MSDILVQFGEEEQVILSLLPCVLTLYIRKAALKMLQIHLWFQHHRFQLQQVYCPYYHLCPWHQWFAKPMSSAPLATMYRLKQSTLVAPILVRMCTCSPQTEYFGCTSFGKNVYNLKSGTDVLYFLLLSQITLVSHWLCLASVMHHQFMAAVIKSCYVLWSWFNLFEYHMMG